MTTVAAAEGTRCGHNKICLGGDCVDMFESTGRSVANDSDQSECIYGDSMISNATFNQGELSEELDTLILPDPQMTCDEFMEFVIDSNLSPFIYCAEPVIRKACCQTCQSKSGCFVEADRRVGSVLIRFISSSL